LTSKIAHLKSGMMRVLCTYIKGLEKGLRDIDSLILFVTKDNRMSFEKYSSKKIKLKNTDNSKLIQELRFVDVIHFAFNEIELEQNLIPTVVTICDLIPEHFPDLFPESIRKKRRYDCQNADFIITISEYVRDDVIARYGIDSKKIRCAYPSIEEIYKKKFKSSELSRVKKKYHLPEKFLLYPATARPHKNHETLFKVFNNIRTDISLVLTTGETHRPERLENLRMTSNKYTNSRIKILGHIEENDFPVFYSLAHAVVIPSLSEGFGYPAIEAMALSCPVVCSNVTSLPEIAGNGALYFDPNDPNDMLKKIEMVMNNSKLRENLIKLGKKNIKRFDEIISASVLLSAYREVSGQSFSKEFFKRLRNWSKRSMVKQRDHYDQSSSK